MQYYQIIQQSPQVGYQFYSDASTVLRIDGNREESAVSTMVFLNFFGKKGFFFKIKKSDFLMENKVIFFFVYSEYESKCGIIYTGISLYGCIFGCK